MPYSEISALPASVKDALPVGAQRIWMAAYNSAAEKYEDEGRRASIAWAAVKNAGWEKDSDGNWHRTEKAIASAEAALTRLRRALALARKTE